MLGTHGHWAMRVLWRSAHILWHGTSVYYGYLRDPWHSHLALLASFWQWSCPYTCFNDYQVCHGWDSNTQPSACGLSFYLLFGANTLTGFIITAAGYWPARSSVYFCLSFFVLVFVLCLYWHVGLSYYKFWIYWVGKIYNMTTSCHIVNVVYMTKYVAYKHN